MNWQDEGILISKRKYSENANIINIFTKDKGKVSGIVYGGNSRKIKNYLQIGNKIFVIYTSKNENRIGYFKTELIQPISAKYFSDRKKSSAIVSLTSLLNMLLPENQVYRSIYSSFNDLILNFDHKNWIVYYIYWEINLIKELGFGVNLDIYDKKLKSYEDEIVKINIDNFNYQIPKFIIKSEIPNDISNDLVKKSFTFIRNVFLNKFFIPNNLIFPKSRIFLENYYQ